MIAGANDISPSAVGATYLAAVLPSLCVKAAAPHFFHRVSYRLRARLCAALMAASFTLVALGKGEAAQLLGVALASLQGGLGEATVLALCGAGLGAGGEGGDGSSYRSVLDRRRQGEGEAEGSEAQPASADADPSSSEIARRALAMWSSGSGAAGLAGYAWVGALHRALGLPFSATVLLANALAAGWLLSYARLVEAGGWGGDDGDGGGDGGAVDGGDKIQQQQRYARVSDGDGGGASLPLQLEMVPSRTPTPTQPAGAELPLAATTTTAVAPLPRPPSSSSSSWRARTQAVLALYPYTLPLFAVYCAEYLMQSGVWPSIGLPDPSDPEQRRSFYLAAGSAYQAGVFVSRSSGLLPLPRPGRRGLAAMAAAQVALLCFFVAEAAWGGRGDLLYRWLPLMMGCLLAGLLGGSVYVGAFSLIAAETPAEERAFALGAASVADASGIALADATGILVQGCLFRAHAIAGAAFSCGGGGGGGGGA